MRAEDQGGEGSSIGVHGVAEQRTVHHLRLLEIGGLRSRTS
jgi:hypothetical protein